MKIAVWHNLPSGGGKRALYYHVRGLVQRGHTVESWCPQTADQTYLPLNEFITEHNIPLSWKKHQATNNKLPKYIKDYRNLTEKLKAMDEHCQQCAAEINSGGFDILFANSCTFFRTTPIGKYVTIPKIIYLGEPYRWLYEALPQLPWLALPPSPKAWWLSRSYLKQFFKDLVKVQGSRIQMREEYSNAKAFDRILVNSLYSRESVLRAYGIDSKVCYLGIDSELFHPLDVPKENFIVGLGTIYLGKGIERAITALGTICSNKRPKLIWIGNDSDKIYQGKMETLAHSLGVNLTFKLLLTDPEVVDLLNRATALIYTSRLEPFGFAPLEANACGTPVVAIAEGGIRETVKDGINGFLVNDDDPIALGEKISKLLEDRELVESMSLQARQNVLENWSWDSALDRLEQEFFKILSEKAL